MNAALETEPPHTDRAGDRAGRSTRIAPLRAPGAASDFDALASALSDSALRTRLLTLVSGVARRRYGIGADDAEDVFQDAVLTYLLVRGRFPHDANHFGLLVGICHRKALSSLTRKHRCARRLERLAERVRHERRTYPQDAPDWAALRAERDAAIRNAVAAMPPDARETLLSLAEGPDRRRALIARLGINRNTFDSRLHAARRALRLDLARRGGF